MTASERIVVITTASYSNPSGQEFKSRTYHVRDLECHNAPESGSKHYAEFPESTAIAFGRKLCKSCAKTEERTVHLKTMKTALEVVGADFNLDAFLAALPPSIDVRFYGYVPGRKDPMKIFSSKEGK